MWAVMGLDTCSASGGRVGVMWEPCGVRVVAMWRALSVYSPKVLKGVRYKYWVCNRRLDGTVRRGQRSSKGIVRLVRPA